MSDLPLCNITQNFDQTSIPDYNFEIFAQTAEIRLSENENSNSKCLQDISLAQTNQIILESWGAPHSDLLGVQKGK